MPLDSTKVEPAAMPAAESAIKSETERHDVTTNLKSRKDDNELGISSVLFDSLTVRLRKQIQS